MGKQGEFEIVPARSVLGEKCIEYINYLGSLETLKSDIEKTKQELIALFAAEQKKKIRVDNYIISFAHRETDNIKVQLKPKE